MASGGFRAVDYLWFYHVVVQVCWVYHCKHCNGSCGSQQHFLGAGAHNNGSICLPTFLESKYLEYPNCRQIRSKRLNLWIFCLSWDKKLTCPDRLFLSSFWINSNFLSKYPNNYIHLDFLIYRTFCCHFKPLSMTPRMTWVNKSHVSLPNWRLLKFLVKIMVHMCMYGTSESTSGFPGQIWAC